MVELSSESDLLRLRREREGRQHERHRVRCVRCRQSIPEGKRADAKYCSPECKRSYRWERRNALVSEVRGAVRAMKTVPLCECGGELDTRKRPGPVPALCKRCYMRAAKRRWRAASAARAEVKPEGEPWTQTPTAG